MILFLYGAEPFLVREKLGQIRAKAVSQGIDATNTAGFDGSDATASAVIEAARALPFLAEQRLVVVADWLLTRSATESEELVEALENVPESTILVVVESGVPDKRRTAFKRLTKSAHKSWDFARLEPPAAAHWLQQRVEASRTQLEPAAATALIESIGTDLWALSTELEKLSAAAGDKPVTAALVTDLVIQQTSPNIFNMVDALGRRDAATALSELRQLLEAGEPALRVLAMIVRQYRLLLGTKDAAERGEADGALTKQLGIQPFLIKKLRHQAESYTATELRQLYAELSEIDHRIKTGRIDPSTALELFVVETSVAYSETAVKPAGKT